MYLLIARDTFKLFILYATLHQIVNLIRYQGLRLGKSLIKSLYIKNVNKN
jgi:hypothetical protein